MSVSEESLLAKIHIKTLTKVRQLAGNEKAWLFKCDYVLSNVTADLQKANFQHSNAFCLIETVDHFQCKQNKMTQSLYNHTKHTTSPEK